jgi:phosphoribosyl 1,2-cyclic phosphodiesterase
VGGDYGHLRNEQAAEILSRVVHEDLQFVVAAHLSEKNNAPELAEQALRAVVPNLGDRLRILKQDEPSMWFEIH